MGSNELVRAGNRAVLIEAIEEHDGVSLTKIDRAYLKALEAWLDMYPEMRTTGSRAFSASAQLTTFVPFATSIEWLFL